MSIHSIRALRILMPVSALTSSIAQTIAILTNEWLYTVELMPNNQYEKFKMPPEMEFNKKFTTSGLWTLCNNQPPDLKMDCVKIDYLNKEEYIPDQSDSTMAIPFAVKRAAIYFFISSSILLLGEIIYLLGRLCASRRIYTFISGIAFILAGLSILTGIVVYISTFKGEVSNKLRPVSTFQEALFHYQYGYSFLTLVASLILCEFTGTLCIFLYITQKQFKIMIDNEREEVLKKNIFLILKDDKGSNSKLPLTADQPILTIITAHASQEIDESTCNQNQQISPINYNFLTPEFGMESSFYQCGRHGTRGRRNSRSNESFLGSPKDSIESRDRSRNNSLISTKSDEAESNIMPTIVIETDD